MRKLLVLTFVSLDGVMQAPGGPEEDTSGGFRHGGWVFPYFDEVAGEEMTEQMGRKFDMLLGRKTFRIFESYWPLHNNEDDIIASGINKARKYVVSTTVGESPWGNSFFIKANVPEEIRKLKQEDGPDIQVHGSANLLQTLWRNDLVDELWLKTFPVVLGKGKRLFEDNDFTGRFELTYSRTSPSGVVIAKYRRAGEVQTGSF